MSARTNIYLMQPFNFLTPTAPKSATWSLAIVASLQIVRTAGFYAAQPRRDLSCCSNFRAARARSANIECTGWALNGHSLRQVSMTAVRTLGSPKHIT